MAHGIMSCSLKDLNIRNIGQVVQVGEFIDGEVRRWTGVLEGIDDWTTKDPIETTKRQLRIGGFLTNEFNVTSPDTEVDVFVALPVHI